MKQSKKLIKKIKKNILIIGSNITGRTVYQTIKKISKQIIIYDDYKLNKITKVEQGIQIYLGKKIKRLKDKYLIVISPGIKKNNIIFNILDKFNILTDLDIIRCFLSQTKFIGITGTNGKSTICMFLSLFFRVNNIMFFLGGNIGRVPIKILLLQKRPTILIIEISNNHLEYINGIKLDIAILFNVVQDHLARYSKISNYYKIKLSIFKNLKKKNICILKKMENILLNSIKLKKKNIIYLNNKKRNSKENMEIYYNGIVLSKRSLSISKQSIQNNIYSIFLLYLFGLQSKTLKTVQLYDVDNHSFNILGMYNKSIFINNAKSSNIFSTINEINSLIKPIHLILGGVSNNENYSLLVRESLVNIKNIYTIGNESFRLFNSFSKYIISSNCITLEKAMLKAYNNSINGDIILFTPTCKSFDQYLNYKKRLYFYKNIFYFFILNEKIW